MKTPFYLTLIGILAISQHSFSQVAERFDLVITEIMPDPSPVIGLPNAEYIEIRNRSSKNISLAGWKFMDGNSTGTINSNHVIQPDSIVILCANSQVAGFSNFGKAIGVSSFPSLDNDGDLIYLQSPEEKTIHSVAYSASWYPNNLKKDGGWSLEIIDINMPCSGKTNWTASSNSFGGTPGKINSVDGISSDQESPQLLRTFSTDSLNVIAVFNEPLDSTSASVLNNYTISNNINILFAKPLAPLFDKVHLQLSTPIQKSTVYTLRTRNVTDCMNNAIGAFHSARLGWHENTMKGDIVINEILFNPRPGAFDFIELFNASQKIIDVSNLYLANRNASGELASAKKISEPSFYIFPGDHIVISEDLVSLESNYLVKNEGEVLIISSLPSYPDDEGIVIIANTGGEILDEVPYSEKWHFGLISNPEGVSIEKVDPLSDGKFSGNWHSAASTNGYATPGYKNSQGKSFFTDQTGITIQPVIFSPNNDGMDDLAFINYKMQENGYVANIMIFDAMGRPVRTLTRNGLMGLKGHWTWDGLDNNKKALPPGIYIIYIELFNLQGKKLQIKNTIALTR